MCVQKCIDLGHCSSLVWCGQSVRSKCALFVAASDEVIAERNDIEVLDLKISPGKSLTLILSMLRLHSGCVLTCSARCP